MFPKSSEVLRWWPESGRSITRACGDKFKKVEISSWSAKPIDCQHSVEKLVACYFIILCNVFTVAFVFYDIAVPRLSPWRVTCVYMSWLRDIYIPKMSLPNLQLLTLLCYFVALRCVTLRYVDEVMDLLSILTRMLDGQSFEISPNKWHSLCTPPVFRSTRPNDLRSNQQNYQI